MSAHDTCTHGVTFDYEASRTLGANEVRRRWPRAMFTKEKPCPACGFVGIAYASTEHFIAGDW